MSTQYKTAGGVNMRYVSVLMPLSTYRVLQRVSKGNNRSVSGEVRFAVENHLKKVRS